MLPEPEGGLLTLPLSQTVFLSPCHWMDSLPIFFYVGPVLCIMFLGIAGPVCRIASFVLLGVGLTLLIESINGGRRVCMHVLIPAEWIRFYPLELQGDIG